MVKLWAATGKRRQKPPVPGTTGGLQPRAQHDGVGYVVVAPGRCCWRTASLWWPIDGIWRFWNATSCAFWASRPYCAGRHQRGQQHLDTRDTLTPASAGAVHGELGDGGNAAPPPLAQTLIRRTFWYARAPAIAGSGCASRRLHSCTAWHPRRFAQTGCTGRFVSRSASVLRCWRIASGNQQPRLAGLHHAAHAHHVQRHQAACGHGLDQRQRHASPVVDSTKIWWYQALGQV